MLADYGKLHVSSTDYTVLRPDGVDAATRGWRTALAEGRALRVRGSGHGLSGATLPRKGETLLCTRGLDHYRIEAPGLITVGGGAILWDVRDFVAARGWRLPVYNGGWAGPTVGGFVSAGGLGLRVPVGEHGKPTAPQALDPVSLSERHGGFWAQAVKLTIIDGRGRVHDVLPGDEDFPWMFASMGQFGLILEATLRLVPQPGRGRRVARGQRRPDPGVESTRSERFRRDGAGARRRLDLLVHRVRAGGRGRRRLAGDRGLEPCAPRCAAPHRRLDRPRSRTIIRSVSAISCGARPPPPRYCTRATKTS